jgi:hypothetical protein
MPLGLFLESYRIMRTLARRPRWEIVSLIRGLSLVATCVGWTVRVSNCHRWSAGLLGTIPAVNTDGLCEL